MKEHCLTFVYDQKTGKMVEKEVLKPHNPNITFNKILAVTGFTLAAVIYVLFEIFLSGGALWHEFLQFLGFNAIQNPFLYIK